MLHRSKRVPLPLALLLLAGACLGLALLATRLLAARPLAGERATGSLSTRRVVVAVLPTLTATATPALGAGTVPPSPTPFAPPPTFTARPTITRTPTPGPSPTPSRTPSPTATASPSPTGRPQRVPTLAMFAPTFNPDGLPTPTPATAIPTAVPTFELPAGTTNVLLLGSDTPLSEGESRTDTMIVASINTIDHTASMLSLPRDLYVYVPGWTMARINQAMSHGAFNHYPGGGVAQLEDTILYNFGIPIHYYARIDFEGFKTVVNAIGGVEIAVSCALTDWRLKSPELDPSEADNWERFTLPAGLYKMDGDLALWYVRSRLSSSDFERNRRQQQFLRSVLNEGVDLGLIKQAPALWQALHDTVETDMDVGRALQLASIAPEVRQHGVQQLHLINEDLVEWNIPNTEAIVYLPNWESAQYTVQRLLTPPSLHAANRTPILVQIINGTGNPDMAALAADNLSWHGFVPILGPDLPGTVHTTTLTYYAQNFKGSYDWLISWIFNLRKEDILLNSQDAIGANYRVVLGTDYDPCRPQRYAPREFLENQP